MTISVGFSFLHGAMIHALEGFLLVPSAQEILHSFLGLEHLFQAGLGHDLDSKRFPERRQEPGHLLAAYLDLMREASGFFDTLQAGFGQGLMLGRLRAGELGMDDEARFLMDDHGRKRQIWPVRIHQRHRQMECVHLPDLPGVPSAGPYLGELGGIERQWLRRFWVMDRERLPTGLEAGCPIFWEIAKDLAGLACQVQALGLDLFGHVAAAA